MYTQKKAIDNTHVVRERDRQRTRELFAVLSLGVPIGLFLLLFTWQNLEVIRLGREATRLQKTLKDVEAEHKALQAELDRLTSFDLAEKKVTDLGFAATDAKSIVLVDASTASRQPPTATTVIPSAVEGSAAAGDGGDASTSLGTTPAGDASTSLGTTRGGG